MGARILRLFGIKPRGLEAADPCPPPSTAEQVRRANIRSTLKALTWWAGISAAATVSFGVGQLSWRTFATFASAGLLLAAASASVGALVGFLFGIPRSLQRDSGDPNPAPLPPTPPPSPATPPAPAQSIVTSTPAVAGQPVAPPPPAAPPPASSVAAPPAASIPPPGSRTQAGLGVNTNLEQISDWLTKILVGVGLTSFPTIGQHVWTIAQQAAPPLAGSTQIALFCMISFSIWGFFAAYLLTRLFLAAAFVRADVDSASANQAALDRHEHAGTQLAKENQHAPAAEQYSLALQFAQTPDERRRLAENSIYNSLYVLPPDGFLEAIRQGQAYLGQPGNLPSARIWVYLAAARGQQYSYGKDHGASDQDLATIESEALTAIREAIKQQPAMKPLLRSLWDPNDPSRASPDENDLEVFYPKESFAALLK